MIFGGIFLGVGGDKVFDISVMLRPRSDHSRPAPGRQHDLRGKSSLVLHRRQTPRAPEGDDESEFY